jgi:hypothetical protein
LSVVLDGSDTGAGDCGRTGGTVCTVGGDADGTVGIGGVVQPLEASIASNDAKITGYVRQLMRSS